MYQVPGDGQCLYSSLGCALQLTASEVRTHMLSNPEACTHSLPDRIPRECLLHRSTLRFETRLFGVVSRKFMSLQLYGVASLRCTPEAG